MCPNNYNNYVPTTKALSLSFDHLKNEKFIVYFLHQFPPPSFSRQSKGGDMSSKSVSTEIITNTIYFIRGQKVMLDRNLAELYGVTTGNLNKAVKRNVERFPPDFMFQLTRDEAGSLRFQFGSLKRGEHYKYLPYAFTEQGVAMLSSVLKSRKAVQVNIAIMRVFVKLRETLALHKDLAAKLKELERKVEGHDQDIHAVFEAIRRLMKEEEKPKSKIGFHPQ